MRYFAKEHLDGTIHGLLRFEVSESGLIEQYWTSEGWHRDDFAIIVGFLALGEGDLIELSADQARAHMPPAFDSPAADVILPRSVLPPSHEQANNRLAYSVVYLGSSLIGISHGFETFDAARSFLQEKSDSGKAKCFHWWCELCKAKPLAEGDSPTGHFIEVSIPNVLAISEGHSVSWQWAEPESEWAKSRNIPAAEEFQFLVDRKSRPNWKIHIQCYLP